MTSERPVVIQFHEQPISGGAAYGTALHWRTLLDAAQTPTRALTAGVLDMQPGAVGKRHWHAPPEIYFVFEGEGIVEIDGTTHTVTAGTTVYVPGNARHALTNTGATTLRLFYAFAADGMADITYHFEDGTSSVLK
jgi:oxalate decarboxylase/phosphoglucose isomerase-like protein (cupin superfamily)